VTQRRGFTMIEILVACAVIVILMGLLFLGGKAIINSNKKTSTKTTLANLQGMVTEREQGGGATKVKTEFDACFAAYLQPMPGVDIPDLSRGAPGRTPTVDNHVGRTQNAIKVLSVMPAVKKAISNLPPEQLLERETLNLAVGQYREGAVLLDAWEIPILGVPSTGVSILHETDAGTPRVIRSPDGKPFFMSAGPDGFFSVDSAGRACGDDNIYSFEN
jgi:prepilin-type N-terminal cleavage/methylation domain-containing protein